MEYANQTRQIELFNDQIDYDDFRKPDFLLRSEFCMINGALENALLQEMPYPLNRIYCGNYLKEEQFLSELSAMPAIQLLELNRLNTDNVFMGRYGQLHVPAAAKHFRLYPKDESDFCLETASVFGYHFRYKLTHAPHRIPSIQEVWYFGIGPDFLYDQLYVESRLFPAILSGISKQDLNEIDFQNRFESIISYKSEKIKQNYQLIELG